jgi:SAM-dependent methyltransferase
MITDAAYGKTGPLFACEDCGFLFVVYPKDATDYYAEMQDRQYEEGRAYRAIQQRVLLKKLKKRFAGVKTLLDVGAGTGILLEECGKLGIESVGVEPSEWCAQVAQSHGLKILQGTLPHPELADRIFDAVTAIDVIEHVNDPVAMLKSCGEHLAEGGALVIVTPDVGSFIARLLRRRWWHYRIAHVGYFSRKTLNLALDKTGYRIVSVRRPAWYFEIGYLYQRLRNYIPLPKLDGSRSRIVKWLFSRTIPLNLGDSLEVIACKE